MSDESRIAGITTCRICKREFTGPVGVIVSDADANTAAYLKRLADHIELTHKEQDQYAKGQAQSFLGWVRLVQFYRTTDPALRRQADIGRWWLLQSTLKGTVSDTTIETKTSELAIEITDIFFASFVGEEAPYYLQQLRPHLITAVKEKLKGVITYIRNEIQEPNKYPEIAAMLQNQAPKVTL